MPTIDYLRSLWVSVRSYAATKGVYDDAAEIRAYAALVEGRGDDLMTEISSVADQASIAPEKVKFSKPKTKHPEKEIGTRAHAIAVHGDLASERYVPFSY